MLLQMTGVSKSFGGLEVLSGIDGGVASGEIVGLIGPNGAGKSTLFNLISGIYKPTAGDIQFDQRPIIGLPPHKIARQGLSRTYQLVKIFPSLTALQNVQAGAQFSLKKKERKNAIKPLACLELVGLAHRSNQLSAHMTFCDRRKLEIARALAAAPRLLLLDEPLAGLNDTETQEMITVIRSIRETTGAAVLWVEHKMEAVFSLCDRLIVIEFGQKIAEGTPKKIAADEAVISAYLGKRKRR